MSAKQMIVKFLRGERAGYVTQNSDGSLNVQGETHEVTQPLWDLVAQITSATELTYRTGREEQTPDGRRRVTLVRRCQRGDPDYLVALADTITRGRHTLLGRRVRAYTE